MRKGPRAGNRPEPGKNEMRINDQIRVPRVLLIDEEGTKLGEFLTRDAISLATERGLDLVEVAPTARPPVCRISDFGKMKYEKKKQDAIARKNQIQVQTKEVKVRPKTDDHDIQFKVTAAKKFLSAGNKVKVTVRFRGRELAHRDIGAEQCMRVARACGELCVVESHPRMEGRQMFMILAPSRKVMAAAKKEVASNNVTEVPKPRPESAEASTPAEPNPRSDSAEASTPAEPTPSPKPPEENTNE